MNSKSRTQLTRTEAKQCKLLSKFRNRRSRRVYRGGGSLGVVRFTKNRGSWLVWLWNINRVEKVANSFNSIDWGGGVCAQFAKKFQGEKL